MPRAMKKIQIVPTLSLSVLLIVLAMFLWLVWSSYSNMYNSDAFAIPERMLSYSSGEIGVLQLLMRRHVEHFHAVIFLLGFLDWQIGNGTLIVPRVAGAVAALTYLTMISAVVVADPRLSRNQKWILVASISAVALSASGWVIWTISFQSVVSTFWALYGASLYAACRAAALDKHQKRWALLAISSGAAALFAHGSGFLAILIPAIPLVLGRAWRLAAIHAGGLTALYVAGSWLSDAYARSSATAPYDILAAVSSDPVVYAWTVMLFLGSAVFATPEGALAAGVFCAAWTTMVLPLAVRKIWQEKASRPLDALAMCLLVSGGVSAGLATALRFGWAVSNGAGLDPYAFMESRYFMASSAVWIGLLLYSAPRMPRIGASALAAALGSVFFFSGLSTGLTKSKVHTAFLDMAEASVVSRLYEADLMRWVFPVPQHAVPYFEFMAAHGKGPFSGAITIPLSQEPTAITDRRQVSVFLPDGTQAVGCQVSGPGSSPRVLDNQDRIIAFGVPTEYESNVTAETFDAQDYLRMNPDVAAAVEARALDSAWEHRQLALAAGTPRLARSRQPGWIAFTPTCDVTALR